MATRTERGKLRKLISLQMPIKTSDSRGGQTVTWNDIVKFCWAGVWPISGKDLISAGSEKMFITHRIRINFRDDIVPEMRVIYGEKIFSVISIVNVDSDNRFIDLMCREIFNDSN